MQLANQETEAVKNAVEAALAPADGPETLRPRARRRSVNVARETIMQSQPTLSKSFRRLVLHKIFGHFPLRRQRRRHIVRHSAVDRCN